MSWYGWHFLPNDRRLANGDGREITPGSVTSVGGSIELCKRGLHASKKPLDALRYASGEVVSRVELRGDILEGDDKACATERRVLWMADATDTLHEFACWCAEEALTREREAGREPDARLWAAIETKRAWLRGEASKNELVVAWAASRAAAKYAAYSAAQAAARDAAYAAQNGPLKTVLFALRRNGG